MDFFEVVKKRGSYRGPFVKKSIPDEDLEKIMEAAIAAPSGYNLQTTSYLVVTNRTLRLEISRLLPTPATRTAPVIIVPVTETEMLENGLCFEIEDYAASVENLLLAVTAMGYAGVWMDGAIRPDGIDEKLEELLEIPTGSYVRAIIPIGIPEEEVVQKEKKPLSDRVTFLR